MEQAAINKVEFVREVTAKYIGPRRKSVTCLLYTSDAADERSSVDLGGRRIIKKKKRGRHEYHAAIIIKININNEINKRTRKNQKK